MVHFIQKDDLEAAEFEGEWIILNTQNFTATKLNEIGGFCWLMMKEAQTVESLCNAIEQKYGDSKDISKEIKAFLSELLKCGLIQHAI